MRQTTRYLLLTISFALISYGLLAWQQINFSLTALAHIEATEFHPVLIMAIGLGLLTATITDFIGAQNPNTKNEKPREAM